MSCACFHAQKAAHIAGYHTPSSGDSPEKIYATPSDDDDDDREWYSESPPRRVPPAAEIREMEEEEFSSHSSDPEGPEDPGDTRGKSIEEITAWCIQYERKQKMERIARQQAGIEGIYQAKHMYLHTLMVCFHAAIRAMAARARTSTPQTLARKKSKGYAPRLVAMGYGKDPSDDDEDVTFLIKTGVRRGRFTV